MRIRNIKHKGLRRLVEQDDVRGLPRAVVDKLRDIAIFLEAMAHEDELRLLPLWKPHLLSGDRRGTWALHVTGNWRVTFRIDRDGPDIVDLDYEDYH